MVLLWTRVKLTHYCCQWKEKQGKMPRRGLVAPQNTFLETVLNRWSIEKYWITFFLKFTFPTMNSQITCTAGQRGWQTRASWLRTRRSSDSQLFTSPTTSQGSSGTGAFFRSFVLALLVERKFLHGWTGLLVSGCVMCIIARIVNGHLQKKYSLEMDFHWHRYCRFCWSGVYIFLAGQNQKLALLPPS